MLDAIEENGLAMSQLNGDFHEYIRSRGLVGEVPLKQLSNMRSMRDYEYPVNSWPFFVSPDFVERLHELDGTPQEVLDKEELISFLTPLLRADFRIARHPSEAERLNCPITVLWGTDDPKVSEEAVHGWREVVGGPCEIHQISGDHFFDERNLAAVLEKVCAVLGALTPHRDTTAAAAQILHRAAHL